MSTDDLLLHLFKKDILAMFYTHTHIHIHTYTYTHTHTHIYRHIHTYTYVFHGFLYISDLW